jgi:hypothetical protein
MDIHTDTQLQILRKDTHTKEIKVYGKHAAPKTVHNLTHRLYYDHCEPLSASLLRWLKCVFVCVCIVTMLVFSEEKKIVTRNDQPAS